MKATVIPSAVLAGQGGGGSYGVGVPNVTPGIGPAGDASLSTEINPAEPSVNGASDRLAPKSGDPSLKTEA